MNYECAININPNYADAYVNQGKRFPHFYRKYPTTIAKFNDSIKMYEIAIKINPFDAKAYYNKVERLILIIQEISLIKLENLKRLKICLILHLKWIQ